MLLGKNIYSDMAKVADLPPRKKLLATVWGGAFCMACAIGLSAGFILVAVICESIPVLLRHWFG